MDVITFLVLRMFLYIKVWFERGDVKNVFFVVFFGGCGRETSNIFSLEPK